MKLYSYQQKAVDQLKSGSILCGGVGSGKSITALAYFHDVVCCGDFQKGKRPTKPIDLYIITTARKRDTLEWDKELTHLALSKHRKSLGISVTIDSWNNVAKYVGVEKAFFIFDEQRVIGSGAWTKSFLKIAKKNKWILLSATPGDVWMDYIPVFIANKFYKNRTEFFRKHIVFSRFTKYPKVDYYIHEDELMKHRDDILVFMEDFRSTKRNNIDVKVGYDEDLYSSVMKKRWNVFKEQPCRDAAELIFVLREIVNKDSERPYKIMEIQKEHPKLIIFYNYNYELDILRKLADYMKITSAEWNGSKHESVPSTDEWLYFVQYNAGAEGWNCVETDTVIFYSLNYSYKMMTQAAGRIDRVNTPYSVLNYYYLKSDSSIDKAIQKALDNKKTFQESAFISSHSLHTL